jgi:ATP/maltotriose-dependent transcriptional regulator MalT
MGEIDAGLAEVERGFQQCRTTIESYQEPDYHRLKGELLKCRGDLAAAEQEIRTALSAAREQGATWIELGAALSLARIARLGDGPADALSVLAEVTRRLTEGEDTPAVQEARAILGGRDLPTLTFAR